MPVRTLPAEPDPAFSPPSIYTHPPYTSVSSHPHRDIHDNRLESTVHAAAMPPSNAPPDSDYISQPGWSSPPQPRVYPDPSSIPPHWQINPATLTQLRDGRAYVTSGPAMQGNPRVPWQNPYSRPLQVQPFLAPPPPPIPHKVWILDCKGCGTFLTNRGMKAVLLLRPNVPLYSTDALPINCSAFSPELEVAPSTSISSTASSAEPSQSTRSSMSSLSGEPSQPSGSSERLPTRTCECLTQTLCCHGCGNAVGYMIVTPCQRCTSSITVNNRATNGHRFVFYSSEIIACERHYVFGERGVSRFHPPPLSVPSTQVIQAGLAGLTINTPTRPSIVQSPPSPPSPSTPSSMPPLSPGTALPGRRTSIDYLPTPPPDSDSPFAPNARSAPRTNSYSTTTSPRASIGVGTTARLHAAQSRAGPLEEAQQAIPPVPPNSHSTTPRTGTLSSFAADASTQTSPIPPSPSRARAASASAASSAAPLPTNPLQGYVTSSSPVYPRGPFHPIPPVQPSHPPLQEPLKAGEVLFWHHLLRSGEIPAVSEDPRARVGNAGTDMKGAGSGRHKTIPSGVVAGR